MSTKEHQIPTNQHFNYLLTPPIPSYKMFFSWIWVSLVALLLPAVSAVWDDEAFVVDWHIQQLGPLDTVLTHVDENSIYEFVTVLSKTGVLASVKNAQVLWRKQLDGSSSVVQLSDYVVATATNHKDGTCVISTWDVHHGFLIGELLNLDKQIVDLAPSADHQSLIVLLHDGTVIKTAVSDKVEYTTIGKIEPFDDVSINTLDNGNFVVLYKEQGSNNAHYAFFDGASLVTHALTFGYDTIVESFGAKVVSHTSKYYAVEINKSTGVPSSPIALINGDKFIPIKTDSLVAFEYNRNLEVYTIQGQKQFTIPNVFKYYFQYVNDVFVMYTEYHANIIDADDGKELVSYFLGDDKLIFEDIEDIIPTTNGIDYIASVFEFKNETYSLIRNNHFRWTRDYSLTHVVAQVVVDLEEDVTNVEREIRHEEELDLVQAFLFRWSRHFQDLRTLSSTVVESLPLLLQGQLPFKTTPKDEYFGFTKHLVLATKNGHVVAVNTLNGERVWNLDTNHEDIISMETVGEQIYVFTASGPRFIIDARTGVEVDKQLLQPSKKVLTLNKDEGSFLMESENGLDLILSKDPEDAYFVKTTDKSINGYRVHDKKTYQTWNYEPISSEVVLGYSSRSQDEQTANIGVVLGDRSVLYKYLYPNIATFGVLNTETEVLCIHIIDTLTGKFLHSQYHQNVTDTSSFKSVVGEHWVVYTYYSNTPTPEQKIVVIDMFESLVPNTRYTKSEISSEFGSQHIPSIMSRSYVLPHRIKAMSLTQTKFGVSTKTVIVALENNQIAYIPKYILNSRRVIGRDLTSDEKTEFMMLPYEPIIKLDDNFVLSHGRDVMGVQRIVSFPTNLESTSIVCAYGLDVFCTRVAPSLQFDKLTSSFDKVMLVSSLVLLVVVVAVLRPMKSSKELKKMWIIQPSR